MADAHATAVGQGGARLLTGQQDRLLAVAGSIDVAGAKADRATRAALAVADMGVGLEALYVQPARIAVAAPTLAQRIEQAGGTAQERGALRPVGTQAIELRELHAALLAGDPLVQPIARVPSMKLAQLTGEDALLGGAGAVHMDHVLQAAVGSEAAEHAHDRCDPTASADEQQPSRRRVGQRERAFDAPQSHDRAWTHAVAQERRDLAGPHPLGGDRDAAVGPSGIGCQRVSPPVVNPIDLDAQAQVLPGAVTGPLPARLDQHCDRVRALALDTFDAT